MPRGVAVGDTSLTGCAVSRPGRVRSIDRHTASELISRRACRSDGCQNRKLIRLKPSQPEVPVRSGLRSGSQADWGSLVRGMTITVTTAAGERFTGTVDHMTFDGLVIWIPLEQGQGRRLFVFNHTLETKVTVHGGHRTDPASSRGEYSPARSCHLTSSLKYRRPRLRQPLKSLTVLQTALTAQDQKPTRFG